MLRQLPGTGTRSGWAGRPWAQYFCARPEAAGPCSLSQRLVRIGMTRGAGQGAQTSRQARLPRVRPRRSGRRKTMFTRQCRVYDPVPRNGPTRLERGKEGNDQGAFRQPPRSLQWRKTDRRVSRPIRVCNSMKQSIGLRCLGSPTSASELIRRVYMIQLNAAQ